MSQAFDWHRLDFCASFGRWATLPDWWAGAQETLRLDMDDEAAVEWMQQLLTESATALMPQIMETGHKCEAISSRTPQ